MTFSTLTKKVYPTRKYSSRQGSKVERIIIHHWAGTRGGVERLVQSKDAASANYILLSEGGGTLIGSVPEEFRAWTSGSFEADRTSITIEVQNTSLAPKWEVSEGQVEIIARLLADVAKRYGWSSIDRSRLRGHREFAATACPGPFLYAKIPAIIKRAQEIFNKKTAPKKEVTKVKPKPSKTPVKTSQKPLSVIVLRRGVVATERVKNLQRGLNRVFPSYSKLSVDGSFGPATEKVVREFQRRSKLAVDGIVGPITQAELAKYSIKV